MWPRATGRGEDVARGAKIALNGTIMAPGCFHPSLKGHSAERTGKHVPGANKGTKSDLHTPEDFQVCPQMDSTAGLGREEGVLKPSFLSGPPGGQQAHIHLKPSPDVIVWQVK